MLIVVSLRPLRGEKFMNAAGGMFNATEKLNRATSFMTAFNLKKKSGASFDEAVQYAKDIVIKTHFDYSLQNRGSLLKNPALSPILMFKTFALSMINRVASDFHTAVAWNRKAITKKYGADSKQVKEYNQKVKLARKALAYMAVTGFLLNGLDGIPVVGDLARIV